MKYKKVTSYEINKVSPFVDDLFEVKISARRKMMAGRSPNLIVNAETGDIEGTQIFAINEKVDKEQFTKVFRKGLAGMFGLSKSGIKVFAYIASIAKPNKDMVYFEIDDCKKYTEYKTHQPIMTGLSELIEAQFIARTDKHYKYFINPTMFFNGSRIAFMKVYEVEGSNKKNRIDRGEPNEENMKFLE